MLKSLQKIIKYIPLQQGLRPRKLVNGKCVHIIKYIPLQQGLRLCTNLFLLIIRNKLLSILHYNKD